MKSSVFRHANPSNLRGSLLESNQDHLLNQARSDLAKQELHVESLTFPRFLVKAQRRGPRNPPARQIVPPLVLV